MTSTVLLIADSQDVRAAAAWIDDDVVRVESVGAARRWLAGPDPLPVAVLWDARIVAMSEDHWALALPGVPQWVVLPAGVILLAGRMFALGIGRVVRLADGPAALAAALTEAASQAA